MKILKSQLSQIFENIDSSDIQGGTLSQNISNQTRKNLFDHQLCESRFIIIMSDWVQVYVRGYPKRVGEQDLKKFFNKFGKVQQVRLMYDFAFIAFTSVEEARQAVSGTNGSTQFETALKVELAKDSASNRVKCWNCGDPGHRSNLCPKQKVQKQDPLHADRKPKRDRALLSLKMAIKKERDLRKFRNVDVLGAAVPLLLRLLHRHRLLHGRGKWEIPVEGDRGVVDGLKMHKYSE